MSRALRLALAFLALVLGLPALAGGTASPPPPTPPAVELDLPEGAVLRPTNPDGKPHQAVGHLIADVDQVAPGLTFRLGLLLVQDEGWHSYWKRPGDIGIPTAIEWKLPEGAVAEPYEFPVPQRFEEHGIVSFGYDHQVLLFSEVTLPPTLDQTVLELGASWLVCKSTCVPGEIELSLPVAVAGSADEVQPSASAPLFDHYAAQHPTPLLQVKAFAAEAALSQSPLRPNEAFTLAMLLTPTGDQPLEGLPAQGLWPTFTPTATFSDWMLDGTADDAWQGARVCPAPDGAILAVIKGETFEPEPLPTDARMGGLFQVKVGDEWIRTEYTVPVPWGPADAPVTAGTSPLLEMAEDCLAGDAVGGVAVDAGTPAPPDKDPAVQALEDMFGVSGAPLFGLMLFFAFLGGVILNAMPCVLPVLTMKLYGLVSHAEADPSYNKKAGLAYTGGILVSFWALAGAVVIAKIILGGAVGWGFQMQSPTYLVVMSTIVFAFGLSLFGVFEIPAMGTNAASAATQKSGVAGDFMYGVFATLLSTPCSAPFLGFAIAFAFAQPTPFIFVFFSMVGLGLAFPYLLVAFVPAVFKVLPKPGAWMETFKQLMGFTLVATALWLTDVLGAQLGVEGVVGFLAFLAVVSLAAWVFGHWGGLEHTWRRQLGVFAIAVGIGALGGWAFLDLSPPEKVAVHDDGSTQVDGLDYSEHIPWQPFTEARVAELRGQKTVFIDFTADWCLTCKVNEKTILETEAVREAMAAHDVVALKADWTARDEVIGAWLARYGRAGVPFYLVIPKDASAETIPLSEVITPGMVIEALEEGAGG